MRYELELCVRVDCGLEGAAATLGGGRWEE